MNTTSSKRFSHDSAVGRQSTSKLGLGAPDRVGEGVKEGSLAPNKEVVSEESEREPSSMVASRGADCGEGEAKTGSLSTTMEAGDGEPGSRVRRRPPSMVGLVGPSCWGDEEEGRNWSTTIEGEEGLGTRELVQPRTTGRCSASQSMVGALGIQLVS
jgi:hypothetical protein